MREMEELHRIDWKNKDRSWTFGDFELRETRRASRDFQGDSIPSGFPWLDNILDGGLAKGEVGNWLAYPKIGKSLRNDQKVLTPTGWVPIGMLGVGAAVIGGSTGVPQRVRGVFPQGRLSVFRVTFSDGTSSIASGDHLWTVQTRISRQCRHNQWRQLTTQELPIDDGADVAAWIPQTPVLQGWGNPLRIDPYLFGLLLGDGSMVSATIGFYNPEPDLLGVVERIIPVVDDAVRRPAKDRCPYLAIKSPFPGRSVVAMEMDRLGLLGKRANQKFIPEEVFGSSVDVRLGVLAGLCDTDGHVQGGSANSIQFSSASKQLADGVASLVRSLGGWARCSVKVVKDRPYWLVQLTLLHGMLLPVRSEKNLAKVSLRKTQKWRRIKSVEPIGLGECTCISVDDPEGLFITNDYIVTHNTTMLIQHGRAATSIGWKKTYHAVFEGSRELVENRYDSCFAEELYNRVKRGDMDVQKFESVRRQYDMMRDLLVVEGFTDRWDYTVQDISNALKELRVNYGWVPELIVIDYGDLLNGRHQPYRDRLAKETDAFRDIKSLANRGYAIWTASQAQRPKEGAHQKMDLLMTRQIAGVYEKVRICDFLGTLNQNMDERRHGVMRLYAEMYRDNAADQDLTVKSDLAMMRIEQVAGLVNPVTSDSGIDPSTNYQDGAPVKTRPVV
jgi:hypothetical protein